MKYMIHVEGSHARFFLKGTVWSTIICQTNVKADQRIETTSMVA